MNREYFFDFLEKELKKQIDADYILLDLPYYANVGDVLIWQSTLNLLKKIPYKCLYSSSIETYTKPQINENVVVVFLGGGNFGDLWIRHQSFRQKVLKDFPHNKIIQLPQSALFKSDSFLKEDVEIFEKHSAPVILYARERKTYEFFKRVYSFADVYLVPDMVLSFDIQEYCREHSIRLGGGQRTLFVKREDCEKKDASESIAEPYDVGDWPCMEKPLLEEKFYWETTKIVGVLGNKAKNKWTDFFYGKILRHAFLKCGISFLDKYETIYSTRLHSAILAWLLGKNVYVVDNSYGKCKGVLGEWLANEQKVVML